MSLFPEADYTSFPGTWRPDHDKALIEYIRLDNPKTLEEHCIRASMKPYVIMELGIRLWLPQISSLISLQLMGILIVFTAIPTCIGSSHKVSVFFDLTNSNSSS
ncbi:hypothetical protein WN943_007041 [Citrus x changshan-huyou]